MGSVELIDSILVSKVGKLKLTGEKLQHLSNQNVLILCNLIAIPKVLYILRTAPCYLSDQLNNFVDVLRSILNDVLNVDLSNELVWLQASPPGHVGGLGACRAAQLVQSTYLASIAGCSTLVHQILASSCNSTDLNPNSAMHLFL